jgi:hypothetical protein
MTMVLLHHMTENDFRTPRFKDFSSLNHNSQVFIEFQITEYLEDPTDHTYPLIDD